MLLTFSEEVVESGNVSSWPWRQSHRADPRARVLADRHYNRQKPGTPQFVPPGRCLVLLTDRCDAFWVTSWPLARYVKHAWGGAWICSAFRNEGSYRASDLIRQAVAITRWYYGEAPELGMVTFIDCGKVRPTMVRGERTWGWTYRKAGFVHEGWTRGGLMVMRMPPDDMPDPRPAIRMKERFIVAGPSRSRKPRPDQPTFLEITP